MQISKIDILVYPAWTGGESWVESDYGKKYRVVWASKAKRARWMEYAKAIARDPSRLLIAIHDPNGRLEDYLWDENHWQGKQLEVARFALREFPERFYLVDDYLVRYSCYSSPKNPRYLSDLIRPNHDIPDPVGNSAYGHHLDDCVIEVGKDVMKSLGLEKTKLNQDEKASVGVASQIFLKIINKYNPNILPSLYEPLKDNQPPIDSYERGFFERARRNFDVDIVCAIMDSSVINVGHWLKSCKTWSDFRSCVWDYRIAQSKLEREAHLLTAASIL